MRDLLRDGAFVVVHNPWGRSPPILRKSVLAISSSFSCSRSNASKRILSRRPLLHFLRSKRLAEAVHLDHVIVGRPQLLAYEPRP